MSLPKHFLSKHCDLTTYERTSEVKRGLINFSRKDPWRDVLSFSIIIQRTLEEVYKRVRCGGFALFALQGIYVCGLLDDLFP